MPALVFLTFFFFLFVAPVDVSQCALEAGCVFYTNMDIACPLHHEEGVADANGRTKAPYPLT